MPSRDSSLGFLLYYANLGAFISVSILASISGTTLIYGVAILSFMSLIAQDIAWFKACYLAPQDRLLIEKVSNMAGEENTEDLLRDCDFNHHLISENQLHNLQAMRRDWVGVDYEFNDRHCQKIWDDLKSHIDHLLKILGESSEYRNAHNFVITDKSAAEQANRHAAQLLRCVENLRRIYIRKMDYE